MYRVASAKEVHGLAAVDGGEVTVARLLDLRRTLTSALAQIDAMVAARPTAPERLDRNGNLVIGNLVIDRVARRVLLEDEDIRLPRIEFELLGYMVLNRGRLVPIDELIAHIWPGPSLPLDPNGALKVHIRWLRERLADRASFRIVNLRGEGYRLDPLDGGGPLAAGAAAS